MGNAEKLLIGLTALLGLGMAAQWIAWRLRLPSILLLLPFGFFAGTAYTALVDPTFLLGDLLFPVVSASVGILLFEGGLSLRFKDLRQHGKVVVRLVTVGALLTWGLGAFAAYLLLDVSADIAGLIGAVLIVSGPTVVMPLLRHIKPRGPTGPILKWEGIVIDPIGAVIALLVFEGIRGHGAADTIYGIWRTLLAGGVFGGVGAVLVREMLRRYWVPDHLHVPFTLTIVLGAFTAANTMQHESGLLATTLMGIMLANQKKVSVKHILEFKENLSVLLVSSLFILLAAQLSPDELGKLGWGAFAFLGVLVLIARPIVVAICSWRSSLERNDKALLAWLYPRGIVAAAVASVFAFRLKEAGVAGHDILVPVTFLVIVGSVVLYGLTAGPLAKRLGLSSPNPQGVVFIGAQNWAREIAKALHELDVRVLMVDSNRYNARQARLLGLPTYTGNAMSEYAEDHIDLSGIGRVLSVTPNDEVNSLVCLHFRHEFGRREVYRLVGQASGGSEPDTAGSEDKGRRLFDEDATYAALRERFARGAKVRATKLTEQFDYAAFRAQHGDSAWVLFAVGEKGSVTVNALDQPLEPGAGKTVVAIVDLSANGA